MTEYLWKLLDDENQSADLCPKPASARRAPLIEFKAIGIKGENRRMLYFSAFNDDLFTRDNDLNSGNERVLRIIQYTRLIDVLQEPETENGICPLLQRYEYCNFTVEEVPACRR